MITLRRDFIAAARATFAEQQQQIARDHDEVCRRLRAATSDEERATARAEVLRIERLMLE